jgi:hypothetical protein
MLFWIRDGVSSLDFFSLLGGVPDRLVRGTDPRIRIRDPLVISADPDADPALNPAFFQ